jgi:hypothetical protein
VHHSHTDHETFSIYNQKDALTLVLRSTHSSQLSVGLLRFCFFLGGASPPACGVLEDGSGLVDGCVPSSSIFAARRLSYSGVLGPSVNCNATGVRRAWRACHAKASCKMAGISEDDVVSIQNPRRWFASRGDRGECQPPPWHTRSPGSGSSRLRYVSR